MLSKRDQRRARYKQAIKDFGFLVLTRLIVHFQQSEDYEECQMIKEVIEEENKDLGMNYPTVHGEEAFDYFEGICIQSQGRIPDNYIGNAKRSMNRLLKQLP